MEKYVLEQVYWLSHVPKNTLLTTQGSKGHGAASDGWKAEMSAFSISSILGGHYE